MAVADVAVLKTDCVIELPTEESDDGRSSGPHHAACGAPPGIFRSLGFYGMAEIEVSILAGLVTGDPVLLVGSHGSAKTALVRRLAAELGLRFWAYDASKALFEDVIGFPNPRSLGDGLVEYVATPLTVWDKEFLLLDEISRASPAMQNKWLELVRSRRVMGREVPALRYVFAAMNPTQYLGANPLDEALAGRFAFVVPVPDVLGMSDADLVAIVETATPDDAPLCPVLHEGPGRERPSRSSRRASKRLPQLRTLLDRARASLPTIVERHGELVTRYVCAVAGELSGKKLQPDGRRLGMLRRNLLAVLALEEASDRLDRQQLEPVFFRTLDHSLPHRATAEAPPTEALYPCHALAWRAAVEGPDASGVFSRLAGRGQLGATLRAYEQHIAELSEEDHHQTLNGILQELDGANDVELGRAVEALVAFTRLVARHQRHVPCDVTVRAFERLHKLGAYGIAGWGAYTDVLDRGEKLQVSLESARQSLALRVAVEHGRRDDDDPDSHVDASEARARYRQLLDAFSIPDRGRRRESGPDERRRTNRRVR